MKRLAISIRCIQHLASLDLDLDLAGGGLHCFVGRNGVGKTTLVRALRNLSSSDTFALTAGPRIFNSDSSITYVIDGREIFFGYDERIGALNCRQSISADIKGSIHAELPIPHGARFNYFRSASLADADIRKALALELFDQPRELRRFLTAIYSTDRFESLVEVRVKNRSYYAIAKSDLTYVREDYLSSGEYFLISLYRTIASGSRLIVIDEIDISLDAAAQSRLAEQLRKFCDNYGCSILFTTHSMALMKTLKPGEINYLENNDGRITSSRVSYSYVKARLFGFLGWDKYILTEDRMLTEFLDFLISSRCGDSFFRWKIIHIGGGDQVVDLLKRNAEDGFLSESANVIAVLDGDRSKKSFATHHSVILSPIQDLEEELFERRLSDSGFPFVYERNSFTSEKDFFMYLLQKKVATKSQIFTYLLGCHEQAFQPVIRRLVDFLGLPNPGATDRRYNEGEV